MPIGKRQKTSVRLSEGVLISPARKVRSVRRRTPPEVAQAVAQRRSVVVVVPNHAQSEGMSEEAHVSIREDISDAEGREKIFRH
jgi:hypothetical protein